MSEGPLARPSIPYEGEGSAPPRAPARKRSLTIQPDVDAAIVAQVGPGGYSKFVNEALIMALQARGIAESIADFEREHGPLTEDDFAIARRRIVEADTDLAAFLASRG
jgi:hypothetical protein